VSTLDSAPASGDTSVYCARHPNVETVLRCGRCDTPICPRCLVATPVGARCPDCARIKRFNFLVKPKEFAKATAMGLAVAAVGSLILQFIPFIGLLGLAFIGFAVGEAVSVGANRKRARELGPLAVACFLVGIALGPALTDALNLQFGQVLADVLLVPVRLLLFARAPLQLVGLGVGALLAWMRVR
jgi:uncharacterized membrane protein